MPTGGASPAEVGRQMASEQMGMLPPEQKNVCLDGKVVGTAQQVTPQPKRPERFIVTHGGFISRSGFRTIVRPGKLIDAQNFDLAELRAAGIEYKPFEG
jgi:hypothetical protein